jgi:hypothetical protein
VTVEPDGRLLIVVEATTEDFDELRTSSLTHTW